MVKVWRVSKGQASLGRGEGRRHWVLSVAEHPAPRAGLAVGMETSARPNKGPQMFYLTFKSKV